MTLIPQSTYGSIRWREEEKKYTKIENAWNMYVSAVVDATRANIRSVGFDGTKLFSVPLFSQTAPKTWRFFFAGFVILFYSQVESSQKHTHKCICFTYLHSTLSLAHSHDTHHIRTHVRTYVFEHWACVCLCALNNVCSGRTGTHILL